MFDNKFLKDIMLAFIIICTMMMWMIKNDEIKCDHSTMIDIGYRIPSNYEHTSSSSVISDDPEGVIKVEIEFQKIKRSSLSILVERS